jgi:hypothetical protein
MKSIIIKKKSSTIKMTDVDTKQKMSKSKTKTKTKTKTNKLPVYSH